MLLEGHSYVCFLPRGQDPRYFCLIRVAQKHPCMVLHIGYIEGTPHSLQTDTVAALMTSLQQLAPPTSTSGKKKASVAVAKERQVVTIVGKQLQRVIIRYCGYTYIWWWVWLYI